MSDNFHQSVNGGTGANHIMLGSGSCSTDRRSKGVRRLVKRGRLLGLGEILAGRSIRLDDALGKKVSHCLSLLWDVSCKNVIEGAVFADDDDHVLDRRTGVIVTGTARRLGLK